MALSLEEIDAELARRQEADGPSLSEIDSELQRRGVSLGDILPSVTKEAISGAKELGTQISGLPRDAMRTIGTTVANTASGVRPDIALAEAAMTQMRPDATQVTPQEKTAGLAANIQDPRMMVANPVAEDVMKGIIIPGAKGVGRQLARLQSVFTGIPPEDIARMAEKPAEIMTATGEKKAGKIFQKAKESAGVTEAEERLIAGIGDPSGYKRVADEMAAKYAEKGSLTTGEALAWKKAAGELSRNAKGSAKFIYGRDAAKAQNLLQSQASEVAKTQAEVGLAKVRSKFLNVLPLNKGGTPAVVRTLIAGGVGAGVNPALAPFFSPIANLPVTLAAGAVNKGLNIVSENPALRKTLLGILQQLMQKKKSQ